MRAFGLKVQLNDFNVFLVDCNKFPSGPFRIRQILELPEGDKIPSFQGPPKTIQSAATLGQSKCLTVVAVPTYWCEFEAIKTWFMFSHAEVFDPFIQPTCIRTQLQWLPFFPWDTRPGSQNLWWKEPALSLQNPGPYPHGNNHARFSRAVFKLKGWYHG